ncbi:hypothetical protein M422DRAFT_242472 [Sphaerobolus stellatus SS14]|nr:hypothetical protein M422DRAFT_242472 [Sphaerobolus stellatus SS14]
MDGVVWYCHATTVLSSPLYNQASVAASNIRSFWVSRSSTAFNPAAVGFVPSKLPASFSRSVVQALSIQMYTNCSVIPKATGSVIMMPTHFEAHQTPFNILAFCSVVADTVEASSVTPMEKVTDSLNRVFHLKFDNRKEYLATFPTSPAGPAYYAVASEAATIDFLRGKVGIPIPKVLGWNARRDDSEVGAEYIIREAPKGSLLRDVWEDMSDQEKSQTIGYLAVMTKEIVDLRFTHSGSIYSRDNMAAMNTPSAEIDDKFCFGPILCKPFWNDERQHSTGIDRGSWKADSTQQFLQASITREAKWILEFSTSLLYDEPNAIMQQERIKKEHLELLSIYEMMPHHLIPQNPEALRPIRAHQGYKPSNIYVDYEVVDGKKKPKFPLKGHLSVGVSKRLHFTSCFQKKSFLFLSSLIARLPAFAECSWRAGTGIFSILVVKLHNSWDQIAPSSPSPLNSRDIELLNRRYPMAEFSKHVIELRNSLMKEFGLGECGHVKGDMKRLEEIEQHLEIRKQTWLDAPNGNYPKVDMLRC